MTIKLVQTILLKQLHILGRLARKKFTEKRSSFFSRKVCEEEKRFYSIETRDQGPVL